MFLDHRRVVSIVDSKGVFGHYELDPGGLLQELPLINDLRRVFTSVYRMLLASFPDLNSLFQFLITCSNWRQKGLGN